MSNQVEKATTVVQAYVTPSERKLVQQAVEAANERVAACGQRPLNESAWARQQLVKAAQRFVRKPGAI